MTRPMIFGVVSIVLLVATAGLLVVPLDARDAPHAYLDGVPAALGGWTVRPAADPAARPAPETAPRPVPDMVAADPRAEPTLLRAYVKDGATVWLNVGFYPTQVEGQRPAARELLFPRKGWNELTEQPLAISVAGGRIDATAVVIRTASERLAVVYWYQVGAQSVASDHGYRALLFVNRLVHRRSDGALVRVATPVGDDPDPALRRLTAFVETLHPELLRSLPR